MKRTLSIVSLIIFFNCFAQSQEKIYVTKQKVEGYVFTKDFHIWGFPPEYNRYTPTKQDIEIAESILQENAIFICNAVMHKNLRHNCAKKKLRSYVRQYVGYIIDNKKIVKTFFSKRRSINIHNYKEDIIGVQDGGTDYWQVSINLSDYTLFGLSVNGEG